MNPYSYSKFFENEQVQEKKLKEIVLSSIQEEQLISHKLYPLQEKRSIAGKLADKVAEFGGSWRFIISFMLFMLVWVLVNIYFLKSRSFDPYPFILLNLVLSFLAALQAPFIMMSQNRRESKDRKRAENDYLINLKAEIEIRNLHEKIDLLMAEQMKSLFDVQKAQMEAIEDIRSRVTHAGKGQAGG